MRTDVIVVGGGGCGLAAAAQLGRGGARVLVLDRDEAERNRRAPEGGLLLPGTPDGPSRLRASLGEERAASIETVAERGRSHLLACGRAVEGTILLVPYNTVERDELPAALHPYGASPAGSRWPAGTMSVPSGWVEPADTLDALAGAARAAGAVLRGGVEVRRIDATPDGCRVAGADGGILESETVLLAAGLGARPLSGAASAHLYPCRGQACDAPPGLGRVQPLGAVRRWGHEEYRFLPDRTTLLAWNPQTRGEDVVEAPAYAEAFERHAIASASEWLGPLRPPSARSRRAAAFAWPRDGLPLAGPESGNARVWIAAGFMSRSLTFGVGCGLAVADAILGRRDALPPVLAPRRVEA